MEVERGERRHMVCRRPWCVYMVAPTETSTLIIARQAELSMGCAREESRFLILQYPHKIFAVIVKVDGG